MNKQELIEAYERISSFCGEISVNKAIENLKQLDESGIYVKNILARLRELPLHDREVWLKAIMDEFEEDFCHSIWREGYEQGKFEGAWVGEQLKDADKIRRELNRPIVPQFVADWIELCKKLTRSLQGAMHYAKGTDVERWLIPSDNQETFAKAWLFGYEVEKEKQYLVKIKSTGQCLGKYYINNEILSPRFIYTGRNADRFTRKELEDAGFGEVFNSPLFEVEEAE